MRYEGRIFRPPSESNSYILQVTVGCSYNKCTFCSMYKEKKFHFKSLESVIDDLKMIRNEYSYVKRIFLADGNALTLSMDYLINLFEKINEIFPECERIGLYGAPKDILRKTVDELKQLEKLGLGIIYLGLESGSSEVLKLVNKGVTPEEMVKASNMVKKTGIKLSVTAISGLGGKKYTKVHGIETGKILSLMNPDYIGILTLMVEEGTPLYETILANEFKILEPMEVIEEMALIVNNIDVDDCIFRSNHASNYFSFIGHLPEEKGEISSQIEKALTMKNNIKDDCYRSL